MGVEGYRNIGRGPCQRTCPTLHVHTAVNMWPYPQVVPTISEPARGGMAVDTPGRALIDFSSGNVSKVSLLLTCGMPSFRMNMALLAWGGVLCSVPHLSRAFIAAGLAFFSPQRRRFGGGTGGSWGWLISIVLPIYLEMGSLLAIEVLYRHHARGYITTREKISPRYVRPWSYGKGFLTYRRATATSR
jgi:hypothetical protein